MTEPYAFVTERNATPAATSAMPFSPRSDTGEGDRVTADVEDIEAEGLTAIITDVLGYGHSIHLPLR